MNTHETERLKIVKKFLQHDFNLNSALNDILNLASEICGSKWAFITLIDEQLQWFKVCKGLDMEKMSKNAAFCTHTIQHEDVFVVADPLADERFSSLPGVTDGLVKFYAGAKLTTKEGYDIGALCAVSDSRKKLTESKKGMLAILARQAMYLMELDMSIKHVAQQNKVLLEIAHIQSHEFRGPLSTVMSCMNIIRDDDYNPPRDYLVMMDEAVLQLDKKIHLVVEKTQLARETYRF